MHDISVLMTTIWLSLSFGLRMMCGGRGGGPREALGIESQVRMIEGYGSGPHVAEAKCHRCLGSFVLTTGAQQAMTDIYRRILENAAEPLDDGVSQT